jgi:LysR family transcriptional regulator, transcriptional activator for bauABCD operon
MTETRKIASKKWEVIDMRHLSDIDLRLIRIFCTIVDCNGFPGAQIVLNMAQSTLSTHLASLEAKLGSKLCERGRGGFRVTPAGEDTYKAAQELLRNIERFESTMDRVHLRQTAKLRIGVIDCVTTFEELDLPGAMARFSKRHPEALVELETDTPAGLQNSLLRGTRDIVIGGSLQPMPGLAYREIASETHLIYCGRDHAWFDMADRDLTQSDFLKAAFSVRSYMHFDDTYRLGRVTARATVGSMEAQEILILSGRYVGFLPAHRGGLWESLGRMRAVKPNDWSMTSRFYASHDRRREGEALRRTFMNELFRAPVRGTAGASAGPGGALGELPVSELGVSS